MCCFTRGAGIAQAVENANGETLRPEAFLGDCLIPEACPAWDEYALHGGQCLSEQSVEGQALETVSSAELSNLVMKRAIMTQISTERRW